MIYPVVKYGNPVLEKPAEIVTVFDHVPSKDSGPEVGHGTRFDSIDANTGDSNRHDHDPVTWDLPHFAG